MTREQCDNALSDLFENHDKYLSSSRKPLIVMEKLIEEHFDNPPLSFEDLKKMLGEPVWDNKVKIWFIISEITEHSHKYLHELLFLYGSNGSYEVVMSGIDDIENRFFRKKVE